MFTQKLSLTTRDGVCVEGLLYEGGNSNLVLVAHGFFQNKDTRIMQRISESFLNDFDVLVMDFRRHGSSGGTFTLTAREWDAPIGSIDYHFWRKEAFDNLIENFSPNGIGKGVRLGNPFLRKFRALERVRYLRNTPVFFIHGTHDWLIRPRHSQKMHEYAPQPKKLHIVENGLHAEKMYEQFPDDLQKWTLEWFHQTLGSQQGE
ncbi:MAG: alpha/beta hydrolase [Candidatus Omnitrophica bacterium]|nr:alpha/beta hydrolase [Candidatus Omnitrophota bacterium]